MHRVIAFSIFVLLIGCQGKGTESATVQQRDEIQHPPTAGWTIDETMEVRSVDNIRISPDGRRVLFAVRTAVLSGDKGEYLTQIYSANADGTNERSLTDSSYSATAAERAPAL